VDFLPYGWGFLSTIITGQRVEIIVRKTIQKLVYPLGIVKFILLNGQEHIGCHHAIAMKKNGSIVFVGFEFFDRLHHFIDYTIVDLHDFCFYIYMPLTLPFIRFL
jgi:hypothetical protein